jgi:hypothetical protein
LDQFPIFAAMRPFDLAGQLDGTFKVPRRHRLKRDLSCGHDAFRASVLGAQRKPPKTAVPPDRQPCATRFHYPSLLAPHLLPKHGRQAAPPPKLERDGRRNSLPNGRCNTK